jgi:hypothetical protein
MGEARDYLCESCGYEARRVTGDFDCGFSGVVVTPVACPEHGVVTADTGLNRRDDPGCDERWRDSYPCPECGRDCPLWDRVTCPTCGAPGMVVNPDGDMLLWD